MQEELAMIKTAATGNPRFAQIRRRPFLAALATTLAASWLGAGRLQALAPAAISPSAAIAASADPDFKLGAVYAYPNPARRGDSPIIHVEAGLADGLDIEIYDLSGELVKSASLPGAPQLIDDQSGRGAQYAYEWKWDVSGVGSGVYVYVVKAHQGARGELSTTKKMAVVK
jgi:hypothetical protein